MNKIFLLSAFIILVFFTSCTTLKRYSRATMSGSDTSLVSIDLFGSELFSGETEGNYRTLWDLNATAQANLLEILNKRYPDNELFINSLSRSYLSSGVENEYISDYTNKDLRLVLSICKKRDYSGVGNGAKAGTPAADRIEYLKLKISLPDSLSLSFEGWNRYTTEYANIDIAGVSFNRSIDIGSDTDLNWPGEALKGSESFSFGSNINRKEDQKIGYRYLKLNGKISEKEIEIEEEGTRETDLTGNITADIRLNFGIFRERVFIPYLIEDEGERKIMALQERDLYVPNIEGKPENIVAHLDMEFLYRHVTKGSKTFQEWDDHVEYYTGKISKEITLFKRDDYLPPIHIITNRENIEEVLTVRTESGKSYTLKFRNFNEATLFFDWLTVYSKSMDSPDQTIMDGKTKLYYKNHELTKKAFSGSTEFGVCSYY